MKDNHDLLALAQPREMTKAPQRIAVLMKRLFSGHYAHKGNTVASVAEVLRERLKHRLGALEMGCETNTEVSATQARTFFRPQYSD